MAGTIVAIALIVWLAAIAAIVGYRMLTGEIETDGLLSSNPDEPIDPERVAMLVGTIAAAAYYAFTALSSLGNGPVTSLPDVPDLTLELLGGSQILYLTGKLARRIASGGNQ
jgi:predicted secreted protein